MSNTFNKKFVNEIKDILSIAKERVVTSINIAMVYSYYEIGRRIVMEEQKGKRRANYGKEILEMLSKELTKEFGRGYSFSNLATIRKFYLVYSQDQILQPVVAKSKDKLSLSKEIQIPQPLVRESKDNASLIEEDQILQTVFANSKDKESLTDKNKIHQPVVAESKDDTSLRKDNQIGQTVFDESKDNMSLHQYDIEGIDKYPLTSDGKRFFLSWGHYIRLMRIRNVDERHFYEIECYNCKWSVRELDRQYNSSLYERLVLSRDKDKVRELSTRGQIIEKPRDIIKEPCVLEFLELKEDESYSEKDLETKIINKLQDFVLELGKGFIFVKRQMRISFEDQHFYPDLVFYNRFLRCFVVIDLKVGTLHPQDIGQMEMYVNYFDRYEKSEEENKTIGILLCKDKNDAMVKLTLPEDNDQIYASKYEMILPSKQDLIRLIKEK